MNILEYWTNSNVLPQRVATEAQDWHYADNNWEKKNIYNYIIINYILKIYISAYLAISQSVC